LVQTSATSSTKATSQEKFEDLLKQTHKQAFSLAYRLTGNQSDAEDLMQDSYIRAYRFFHRYKEEMPFSSWIYRIMTNLFIDGSRKKGKYKLESIEGREWNGSAPVEIADGGGNPEELLLTQVMESDLHEGLQKMTADFRVAVLLADVEGYSYEEIAEIMGTSVGTVRSRIHRGRKQLRSYLMQARPEKYGSEKK
jgi:RNA polymerase sigma-70 factor (ECF subfamily)